MADAMPNYRVEQQRLRARVAEQEANIQRQILDILEMADRKVRHEENIAAARRAIAQYRDELASLEKAHGKLSESDIGQMTASIGEVSDDG